MAARYCLDEDHARLLEKLAREVGEDPGRMLARLVRELALGRPKGGLGGEGVVDEVRRGLREGETLSHDADHMVYLGSRAPAERLRR